MKKRRGRSTTCSMNTASILWDGLPYRQRGISIISVVIDAPQEAASSLSGKLGMVEGVTAKTLTAKL